MHIEPLNLNHQDILESRFSRLNIPLSEYSFANLYLFRKIHAYQVLSIEDEVFLHGLTRDHVPFIMPTSPLTDTSFSILQHLISTSEIVYPISDDMLDSLQKWSISSSFKESDSDYVYDIRKIATYKGRHLDGKRNQVKRFLSESIIRCEIISNQLSDMQYILQMWQMEHGDKGKTDYEACEEAIHYFDRLKLFGHIVYVNQDPAGFILGERNQKNYFTVHFAKGIRTINGIYQYLFQELAKSMESNCTWINLEQDLGIPSLKHSKLSYHPDFLMKKWRLQLRI